MSYEWDVFISYRRETAVREWTHKVFLPIFREWLPHSCGTDVRLFVDQDTVPAGTDWPDELEGALHRARCLVAVLSPDYFNSAWCLAEFHTMLRRQQSTGTTVIVPLQFSDGEFYAPEAKGLQWIGVEHYNWLRSRSRANTRGFGRTVQQVCERVAEVVRTAPAWNSGWPIVRPTATAAPDFSKPEF